MAGVMAIAKGGETRYRCRDIVSLFYCMVMMYYWMSLFLNLIWVIMYHTLLFVIEIVCIK